MATQPAAATRKNTKKTIKSYDEQTVNGWVLHYEYESINGSKPAEIKVNGTKDAYSVFIAKNASNITVSFGGNVQMDADLISSVQSELTAIDEGFQAS